MTKDELIANLKQDRAYLERLLDEERRRSFTLMCCIWVAASAGWCIGILMGVST